MRGGERGGGGGEDGVGCYQVRGEGPGGWDGGDGAKEEVDEEGSADG